MLIHIEHISICEWMRMNDNLFYWMKHVSNIILFVSLVSRARAAYHIEKRSSQLFFMVLSLF